MRLHLHLLLPLQIVRERFVIYEKQTAPLIDYYSQQKKLQDFDVKKGLDDTPRLFKECFNIMA